MAAESDEQLIGPTAYGAANTFIVFTEPSVYLRGLHDASSVMHPLARFGTFHHNSSVWEIPEARLPLSYTAFADAWREVTSFAVQSIRVWCVRLGCLMIMMRGPIAGAPQSITLAR